MRLVSVRALGAIVALAATTLLSATAQASGILYVGDLIDNSLHKFDAVTGALILPNPYIAGITEGVDGTANTIIGTGFNSTKISRYLRTDGTYVNDLATGFSGLGNIQISPSAQYLYAPDEGASTLYQIRVADGAILNSVPLNGAHDVQISPDGAFVYASGYTGSTGIVKYNADLSGGTSFIANGDNGLTRPTGMAFDATGNLWVAQNTTGGLGFVSEYDSAGNFIKSISSPILTFSFGIDFGPDGNLYAASLGSYVQNNYTNCIAKIDVTTDAVTPFIVAPSGINGPKYLRFDRNFSPNPDPSPLVPEPGAVAFGIIAAGSVLGMAIRKRKTA